MVKIVLQKLKLILHFPKTSKTCCCALYAGTTIIVMSTEQFSYSVGLTVNCTQLLLFMLNISESGQID